MRGNSNRGAVISSCELYRYRLWRGEAYGRQAIFVGCNPSTADAEVDDATVRKMFGFSARWGCSGFEMLNACGLRARNPKALLTADDPVGPGNRDAFEAAFREARQLAEPLVVVGWGSALPRQLRGHAMTTLGWLEALGAEVHCLGLTKAEKQPRHPLMLAYSTPLEPFRMETGHG